ncbi:MAG: succinate dehydrogenase, cytochrome b556 subunit [Gammaproteobacteria bacterium]|nr:succinate dehydrogenase, cytochrome b556 subunit [Gammaproteobacteria bacterium]
MGTPQRPLSPHLGIYRWQLTMALSILHRMSGVFLAIGAVVMVVVLAAIASGSSQFQTVQSWLAHPIGLLLLVGWSFALFLHLANGVRHLIWDAGVALEKDTANRSGLFVIAFAFIATAATWALAWS